MNFDVIIIGSGISALTSAILLLKKGKSVLVLEQYVKPGGYLHSFDRFGLTFDTGSHYIGSMNPGEPFRELLSYLGVFHEEAFVPLNQDGFDVFQFPELKIELCAGVDKAIKRISSYFPSQRAAVEKYFRLCEQTARLFPTYRFHETQDSDALTSVLNVPLSDVVESLTDDPLLQCFFYSYCTLHAVSPRHTPFGFHAVMTDSLLNGPYGFRQGGDFLAKQYVDKITSLGGKVLLRRGVKQLCVENQSITKIVTGRGEEFNADWVISAIHPKAVFRLLDVELEKPAFQKRLNNLTESIGFLGIYAACKEPPPFDFDRNYFLFNSSNPAHFHETIGGAPPPVDAPPGGLYLARNNRCATDGTSPLTIHSPGPMSWFNDYRGSKFGKRPAGYGDYKKMVSERVLDYVDSVWRGTKTCIEQYETSTPLSNIHYNGSEEGSAYGIYHSIENTGARGLGPRTHIRNLLLTGQNTLFPGLMSAAISGLRTAGHIVGIKPILRDLKQQSAR